MEQSAVSGNQSSEDDLEQIRIRENLALVQARMGMEDEGAINPNIQDTSFAKAAHGFWFDNRIRTK